MRIAILSDTQGATPTEGGHGLGRAVYNIAEGLHGRGHDVTLIAVQGSRFSGKLITPCAAGAAALETLFARAAYQEHKRAPFDAIYDHGHLHVLASLFPDLPVVNHFHDKYQGYAPRAVVCSRGQQALMVEEDSRFATARVVHNAISAANFIPSYRADDNPEYVLFLGFLRDYKQPILAIEAAARARVKLVVCGNMVGNNNWFFSGNEATDYRGPAYGEARDELLRGALCLLQLGHSEAGPLTNIEAGLSGTPTVAWPGGGSLDYIKDCVNGVLINTSGPDIVDAVIDAINRARGINRKACRDYTAAYWGDMDRYLEDVERVLDDGAKGIRW